MLDTKKQVKLVKLKKPKNTDWIKYKTAPCESAITYVKGLKYAETA